jgi:hypothetical protein
LTQSIIHYVDYLKIIPQSISNPLLIDALSIFVFIVSFENRATVKRLHLANRYLSRSTGVHDLTLNSRSQGATSVTQWFQ